MFDETENNNGDVAVGPATEPAADSQAASDSSLSVSPPSSFEAPSTGVPIANTGSNGGIEPVQITQTVTESVLPSTAPAGNLTPTEAPSSFTAPSSLARLLLKAKQAIMFRKTKKLEKIMALATATKSVTNDQVQKLLLCSDASATRYLEQLIKQGRLKQVGHTGQAVRYQLAL